MTENLAAAPNYRIIHAFTSAGGSMGVDVAIRELATAQFRAGADIHMLVKGAWADEAVIDIGIPIHRVEDRGILPTLRSLLAGKTVLHSHVIWSPTTLLPLLHGKRPGLVTAISPHGCLAQAALDQKRWKKRVGWFLAFGPAVRAHDALIATSEAERADCHVACPQMPALLLPNAIAPPVAATGAVIEEHTTIGFLGRIDPIKGVVELIDAWRGIADAHPGWRLRIAGPDGEPTYAAHVRALAAPIPSISVEGPLFGADKWRFLSECAAIAVPSHAENFCLVVAEAYLMATPVVATPGVPWPELVSEKIGWRTDDATTLADALEAAISAGPDIRANMGGRGRAFVEARYGHDMVARTSFGLYDRLQPRLENSQFDAGGAV